MDLKEFQRYIDHETQWLKYYGYRPDRKSDTYYDHLFYERIHSIGYTKVIMPLSNRCVAAYITSKTPVLESSIDELYVIGRSRNHKENIYNLTSSIFSPGDTIPHKYLQENSVVITLSESPLNRQSSTFVVAMYL